MSNSKEYRIDGEAIRWMVEDFWRSILVLGWNDQQAMGNEAITRFEQRIHATAATMPQGQAEEFLAEVERPRDSVFQEYARDRIALKRRLGLEEPAQQGPVVHVLRQGSSGNEAGWWIFAAICFVLAGIVMVAAEAAK